jgi:hypothetical protein
MDEKTGKFTGTFVAPNGDNLNISGGFNFNSEKNVPTYHLKSPQQNGHFTPTMIATIKSGSKSGLATNTKTEPLQGTGLFIKTCQDQAAAQILDMPPSRINFNNQ